MTDNLFTIDESVRGGSLIGLLLAYFYLFLSYYDLLQYLKLKTNYDWVIAAWVYLFLNLVGASIINYFNEGNAPQCPKCKRKLKVNYECNKCGELQFKKS